MKYIVTMILGIIAIMVMGYIERGYLAVGPEVLFPGVVFGLMMKDEKESR